MALNPKPAEPEKTDAQVKAEREAGEKAAADAIKAGAEATEEARKASLETEQAQADLKPYPSQDQADAIKSAAAVGNAAYATRNLKA